MEKGYEFHKRPVAIEENIVKGSCYRFTVLTDRMLRMEYSRTGKFQDSATQMVLNRDFPQAEFEVKDIGERLEIITKYFHLYYDKKEFSPQGLEIKMQNTPYLKKLTTWYYGDETFEKMGNLGGTCSTLDNVNGSVCYALDDVVLTGRPENPVNLGRGILSKNGFSVINDSESLIFGEDGWVYPAPKEHTDLYFLNYGRDYLGCLKDFYRLTGSTPLLPRYALGNWWSRYHDYTQEEYMELMERFESERLPFAVSVLDMGWHLTDPGPEYGKGWTGYTWNRALFPNPEGMMEELHKKGKHISLNVHPADGVRAYEEMYPDMAKAMEIDYEKKLPIPFDMTDKTFVEAYFQYLHHPNEERGVDFWWIDWQQGNNSRMKGYDPLWLLNHFHFVDNGRNGKRPMLLSRYAGLGSHRYPIGFSGSTFITWDSLDFQPYFTATASNVGYGWWSHDIGGHRNGYRDDELMARWVQFGVFSPIMRLHSSDEVFTGKEPWKYEKTVCDTISRFLRLRHQLIPYLYAMNERQHSQGEPLIRPVYYHYPDAQEAYSVPNEYFFGTELLVCPITRKGFQESRTGTVKAWIPDGSWYDIFSGLRYQGNRKLSIHRSIEDMPVLAKAGSIVPMQCEAEISANTGNPQSMELLIFTGASGEFSLYEDDGISMDYEKGRLAWTTYHLMWGEEKSFVIARASGDLTQIPQKRTYVLRFYGLLPDTVQDVNVGGSAYSYHTEYSKKKNILTVTVTDVQPENEVRIVLKDGNLLADNRLEEQAYQLLNRSQISYAVKEELFRLFRDRTSLAAKVSTIHALQISACVEEAIMELLLADN